MHAFPQFSMSVAEILSGKWSLQMGMHKGTGGVKLERTGPRFWYKNVGLKNGFEIGFRNGFGFLTLEKDRKWVVCTCHKIKMASKANFKAVFKAKIFAPESGP